MQTVTVFLPFQFEFFFFLSAVARAFSTVLNKTGHPCLVDLRGSTFSFSLLSMVLAVCLYIAFVRLKHVPSTSTLWSFVFFLFYHKWMLNYFRNFSGYMEMIIRFSPWFWNHVDAGPMDEFRAFLPLPFSGRVWEGLVLIFLWCLVEFTSEVMWSWTFIFWRLLVTDSVSLEVIDLLRFFLKNLFVIQSWKFICFQEFIHFF